MYAIFDTDSSFFNLKINTSKSTSIRGGPTVSYTESTDITSDVIELSIIEEISPILNGTLLIHDPGWVHSAILQAGVSFDLSWGYKKRNQTINDILIRTKNPTELTSVSVRTGIKGIVTMPKFILGNNGQQTFSCGFFGSEYGSDYREIKTYTSGTKKEMIQTEMEVLGVEEFDIKFDDETDKLSDKSVQKNETSYKFLLRLAKEWRCIFLLSRTSKGVLKGTFINKTEIGSALTNQNIAKGIGSAGSSKIFEFGVGATYPNVLGGEITHNVGENGQGDMVTFNIVGNKTVVTRYMAQEGKTVSLTLDQKAIEDFAAAHHTNSGTIYAQIMTANSYKSQIGNKTVRDFFVEEEISTAPQGAGYSGNLEVIGDPSLCIPMECRFGKGFPPHLDEKVQSGINNRIFIKKVEHNLGSKGYLCKVEIADVFTSGAYVEGEG